MNPKKDKEGLTPKQAKFVEAALEVGPQEAAKIAYPDAKPETQRVQAYENMKNPVVLLSLSKRADSLGLRLEDGIEAVKDGLKATKLFGKDAVEHEDHGARLKAAELTFKIHGELKESSTTINFLTPESFDLFIRKLNDNPA